MIKPGKRIEFPEYLHIRVAELIKDGLAINATKNGKIYPVEDRKIHDILSDFYKEKRVFNVLDDKDLKDEIVILG